MPVILEMPRLEELILELGSRPEHYAPILGYFNAPLLQKLWVKTAGDDCDDLIDYLLNNEVTCTSLGSFPRLTHFVIPSKAPDPVKLVSLVPTLEDLAWPAKSRIRSKR
jgi:hypothetical protein